MSDDVRVCGAADDVVGAVPVDVLVLDVLVLDAVCRRPGWVSPGVVGVELGCDVWVVCAALAARGLLLATGVTFRATEADVECYNARLAAGGRG